MKKNNKKGFTLAELLIVVAIIAVLVAISIPIFTTQLEKSKEGTDIANLRSAYAAGQVAALTGQIGPTDINPTTNVTYHYDPNIDGSLTTGAGIRIGKGTTKDGKSDVSSFSGGPIQYNTKADVSGYRINVTISGGEVKEVSFGSVG